MTEFGLRACFFFETEGQLLNLLTLYTGVVMRAIEKPTKQFFYFGEYICIASSM